MHREACAQPGNSSSLCMQPYTLKPSTPNPKYIGVATENRLFKLLLMRFLCICLGRKARG